MTLIWQQKAPEAPGLYLRRNPPIQATCRAWVIEREGVLCYGGPVNYDDYLPFDKPKPMADFCRSRPDWWWFGPIPPCPMPERK